MVKAGDKQPIALQPGHGNRHLRALRLALDRVRLRPEELARLRFQTIDGVRVPDDQLALAIDRVNDRRRVANLHGRQRPPDFLAGLLVESHDRAVGFRRPADEPFAVEQRVASPAHNGGPAS